jgi:hypothetical protein
MEMGQDRQKALLSGRGKSLADDPLAPVSVSNAVRFAYCFLLYRLSSTLRLVWLPLTLAGMTLYLCLSDYLSDLVVFLGSPSPKLASRALGTLAAGIFLTLFFYTNSVIALTNSALERPAEPRWFPLRARRQEWLLFSAYLRLFLLLILFAVCMWNLSLSLGTVFGAPRNLSLAVPALAALIAMFWLFVRMGFLLGPIAVEMKGSALRLAWKLSGKNFWRIAAVVFFLLIPGILVQWTGEVVLRTWNSVPSEVQSIPIADYAQFMERTLSAGLVVTSLSSLITLVLLTAGAVAVYENRNWQEALPPRADPLAKPAQESSAA